MAAGKEEVVAFLGPKASYTHQAALSRFPESKYKTLPQTTIEDVFSAVQTGTASQGVVPFENSSNGSVVVTLDLFADLQGRYPDILVSGEIYLAVHHCLLGHTAVAGVQNGDFPSGNDIAQQPRVKPIHDIKHVKKLYSHPQAWGQCKDFLSTYLKGTERLDVSSTSKAAELVAQDTTGTSAAISSRMAGDVNNLDALAENIEDKEGNSTRFFVLERRQQSPEDTEDAVNDENVDGEKARYKSLVSFTVNHGEAGALADCLAVFKSYALTVLHRYEFTYERVLTECETSYKLNLTSINTRPSGEAAWHYIFFVEFMGRKRAAGGAVNDALCDLDKVAQSWRWLGSWENALES